MNNRLVWPFLVVVAACGLEHRREDSGAKGDAAVDAHESSELNLTSAQSTPPAVPTLGPTQSAIGPFIPSPVVAIYWWKRDKNCSAHLQVVNPHAGNTSTLENMMVRVYDVDPDGDGADTLMQKQYFYPGPNNQLYSVTPNGDQVTNGPANIVNGIIPLTLKKDVETKLTEIRVSVGSSRASVTLVADCDIKNYGVSFQNGDFSSWKKTTSKTSETVTRAFAYVPFSANELLIQSEGLSSFTVQGADSSGSPVSAYSPNSHTVSIGAATQDSITNKLNLPPPTTLTPKFVSWQGTGAKPVLWMFDFQTPDWRFFAGGFPLILCPEPFAATSLRAGTRTSNDFAFSAQRSIHANISNLFHIANDPALNPQNMWDFLDGNADFLSVTNGPLFRSGGIMSDVERLIGMSNYPGSQNMNWRSDWLGSSSGWQFRDKLEPSHFGVDFQVAQYSIASTGATPAATPTPKPLHNWNSPMHLGVVDDLERGGLSAPGLQTGASTSDGTQVRSLAALAFIRDFAPFPSPSASPAPAPNNKFFENRGLIARAAMASLIDLQNLQRDEVWHFIDGSNNTDFRSHPYAGAFTFLQDKVFGPYALVGNHLRRVFCTYQLKRPDNQQLYNCAGLSDLNADEQARWPRNSPDLTLWQNVYAQWTELLQRFAYRLYADDFVSDGNQTASWVLSFERLAMGSHDPFDMELSTLYAQRFLATQDAAGWQSECRGPDSGYAGMQHWFIGTYYLETCMQGNCDAKALTWLHNSYAFFQPFSAPEPTTKAMLSGFPFNHRLGVGFNHESYEGARNIVRNDGLVAAWAAASPPHNPPKIGSDVTPIADPARHYDVTSPQFFGAQQWRTPVSSTPWLAPSVAPTTVTISAPHNKVYTVNAPGYYTAIYYGAAFPTPNGYYTRQSNNPNERLSWVNQEQDACYIGDSHYYQAPFTGGGLSLLWNQSYGTSLLAGNWSPLTHHGLVVTDGSTKVRTWEDYFATTVVPGSSNQNRLTFKGSIESPQSQLAPAVAANSDPAQEPTATPAAMPGVTPQPTPNNCKIDIGKEGKVSTVSGLTFTRQYDFGKQAIVVDTKVFAASDVPDNTSIIENIPIAAGMAKQKSVLGTNIFYLKPAPTPASSLTPIPSVTPTPNFVLASATSFLSTTEIRVTGADKTSGLRILFPTAQVVTLVPNGPRQHQPNDDLQIDRVEVHVSTPNPGSTQEVTYCLEYFENNSATTCDFSVSSKP